MNERPDSICPAWRTELLGVFQTAGFLNTNLAGIFARDLEKSEPARGMGMQHPLETQRSPADFPPAGLRWARDASDLRAVR